MPGSYGARLVAWIPLLGNAQRACEGLRQERGRLRPGSIEGNRRTSAKRLRRLLAAFRDGKVFQKGAHFPENVILLNMLINKDL